MILDEVAGVIEGAGIAVDGVNLFKGAIPDIAGTPDDCVGLYEYPGEAPEHVKGRLQPVLEYPRVQVLTRSKRYVDGRHQAERIYGHLSGVSGEIGGVGYGWVRPLQSPFFLNRDDKGRYRFVCNYSIAKELSPTE